MEKKTIIIIVSVLTAAVVATGLGVLIWWLLWDEDVTILELEGSGLGSAVYTAAFTRIRGVGDIFWWFYPTTAVAATTKPLLLWLDGVTGLPPSLLANFGLFGPYDFNLNDRNDSWIDEFNLLFIDTPIGSGFSVPTNENQISHNLDDHVDYLVHTLNSFYTIREEYINTPLYIVGQGSGAQIALQLAIRLQEFDLSRNVRGVVLANGIVSPALAVTQLGNYLEEMGYIDYVGRAAIENYSNNLTSLVNQERLPEAFDLFLTLGDYVNTVAEAVAVNLDYIVEKLTINTNSNLFKDPDYFGQKSYLQSLSNQDLFSFMSETVASALGISQNREYDVARSGAIQASRDFFMIPSVDKVEYILQNTSLTVTIYNGNLDAVSTTPGQLEWVDNLQWSGQEEFKNASRQTLAINRQIEGYFRVSDRLRFYWINAAGQWVPRDSPVAARRVIQLITNDITTPVV